MEYHAVISALVIFLTLLAYIPYIQDIIKGKTQPHVFTWLSVSLTASLAYALQVAGGAGIGAWPMLTVAIICVVIFILSLWRGTKDITASDVVFLLLALAALCLWLLAEQPLLSVVLITCSGILSYFPTIRKSWRQPNSETLVSYQISGVRHVLSLFALERLNLLTVLYPAAWAIVNLLIVFILIVRRKKVSSEG